MAYLFAIRSKQIHEQGWHGKEQHIAYLQSKFDKINVASPHERQ